MSNGRWPPSVAVELSPRACPAFILAGGRSSRFGSDKALVEVGGQPLLLKLREALLQHGHEVSIVADRADRYCRWGLNCLVDHTAGCGPLAGVATALQQRAAVGSGWVLILSCDQLVWRGEWFEQLARQAAAGDDRRPCEVVTFLNCDPAGTTRSEPLPCLLHTRLLPKVLQRLHRRQLSLHGLISDADGRQVATEANPKRWSFNTPQELQELSGYTSP